MELEERILILDSAVINAELTQKILEEAGFASTVCRTVEALAVELPRGVGVLLLTEEVFLEFDGLSSLLGNQPAWSRIPAVMVATSGIENPAAHYFLQLDTEAIILDRPVKMLTLTTAVRSLLNGRKRQYQLRDQLLSLKEREEQLTAASIAAESSSRAKSEFLANMSHEIRTPLSGILGMIELALEEEVAEERATYLDMAKKSAYALLNIINDILDFSRVEAGKLPIESVPFDIRDTVQDATQLLAVEAKKKELRIFTVFSADLPDTVVGDPSRLRQILLNLIGNAVKFTPHGEIEVRVQTDDRNMLRFDIRDTGEGIPEDEIPKLFQMFSQVDASNARKHGGTGLGLALCKKLVEAMGGDIWVKSEIHRGSTFSFRFPLRVPKAPAREQPATYAESDVASQLAGMQLLLAEDDPALQFTCLAYLHKMGCAVVVAGDGAQAFDLWEKNNVDAIIMDIQMPRMDGLAATQKIRAQERQTGRNRTPIIALTAHAFPEDLARAKEAGMDDFLAKPLDKQKLHSILAQLRGCSTNTQSNGPAPGDLPPENRSVQK